PSITQNASTALWAINLLWTLKGLTAMNNHQKSLSKKLGQAHRRRGVFGCRRISFFSGLCCRFEPNGFSVQTNFHAASICSRRTARRI
ncbi:MAG: hypothetical protein ABSC01_13080, partial [Verrucomicrobiota bacterium]